MSRQAFIVAILVTSACGGAKTPSVDLRITQSNVLRTDYVGSATCLTCHAEIGARALLKASPDFAPIARVVRSHHERWDGAGYPDGLSAELIPVESRILAVLDVFEALTASDRPYKKAMPLSQALTILGRMKLDGHIDPDLFDIFINEGVWLDYAKRFLPPAQIDAVEVSALPGFQPLPPA